jgi:type IV pilus assembly protein PilX
MVNNSFLRSRASKQSGVVLVVVLLFMLALTTIAIFSARNATLGEKQARNDLGYQIARQAAETALRDAERDLNLSSIVTPTGATCTRGGYLRADEPTISDVEFTATCLRGQCQLPKANYAVPWSATNAASAASTSNPGEPWWPANKGGLWGDNRNLTSFRCATFTGAVPLGLFTGASAVAGVIRQPDYLIELLTATQDSGQELKDFDCPNSVAVPAAGVETADATTTTIAAQKLNMPCHLFRITSRGFGPTVDSQVILQTYFHIIKS